MKRTTPKFQPRNIRNPIGTPYDWCHICGKRAHPLTEVWFPDNAEHGGPNTEYIRICILCSKTLTATARGEPIPEPTQ